LSDGSIGCCVVLSSGISHLPSRPRDFAASAAVSSSSFDRPASSRGVVHDQRGVFRSVQQQVDVLGAQRGVLLVQAPERHLVCVRQPGAGAHEALVVVLHEAGRLGIERQRAALAVDRIHALEQRSVEEDGVLVGRELRRDVLLDLLQRRVRVGRREAIEHEADAPQQLPALLERDERVLERRSRGIVGDGRDLLHLNLHAGLERRREVCVLDLVERRRAEGQDARRQQRVRARGCLGSRWWCHGVGGR
jgi:hypothetical protein